jgi:hypothetical protein
VIEEFSVVFKDKCKLLHIDNNVAAESESVVTSTAAEDCVFLMQNKKPLGISGCGYVCAAHVPNS